MAGIKISALPAIAAAATGDVFPTVQGGVTYKVSNAQMITLYNAQLSFVPLAGGTVTGPILYASAPVGSTELVNKAYVDTIAQGITVQGACRLATTGALTATYSNGSSGVGATLTNAGALAALTIDGIAVAVNDRILVKNQASSFQNGIYTVTNIGSGAVNWVLTRATDYDQVAEIQAGDLVVINAGTTNTNSSWLQTATVVTIGVSAITFSQFSASLPISLANGGTGASLAASNGGIFYSGASAGAILAGTATANQVLLSGSSSAPAWSAATYPSSTTINQILFSSAGNTVTGLATANNGVLVTSAGGVPSISTTLPAGLTVPQPSIVGVTNGGTASAGNVGEIISSTVLSGSAIGLVSGVPANVTSINVTAGAWIIFGNVQTVASVGNSATFLWTSTTSSTLPNAALYNDYFDPTGTLVNFGASTPFLVVNTASTIPVYLSVQANFGSGAVSASGSIFAVRIR